MTTPSTEPLRTLTTTGHQSVIDYGPVTREDIFHGRWERHEPKPEIPPWRGGDSPAEVDWDDVPAIDPEDCTFRMLEPHEIAAGMSFPHDYQWAGTKRERVRLAGNAVCPPNARDLVWAVVESITGEAA